MLIFLQRLTLFTTGCLFLLGCDDLQFRRTGGPVANEAQTAADAATDLDAPATPEQAPADPPAPTDTAETASTGEESSSHVGKTTKEVLNVQELADDPNWKVVATDAQQVKGFTAAGTVYNRGVALAGTVNLDKWIQMQHAQFDSYPTYEELTNYIAKYPTNMPALRVYQHYGYDEATGQMVILENQQEKQKRHGDLGIE